ncbi:MAG: UvrD-helicase domain-containing protein [Solobacterium sp.]|nr:UvrD-helicase domain-containing protein [Solobacterium sp.]MDD7776644.1 UvrD-helicase domain-containing protein [Solobacterium sp.]MDY2952249.1 UvrD-helicase domain-containing protein [Erysipelotrichaceae bacterium]MDY5277859.1 UvrD-helicase domain-containing protein [Erysipelotrichaceae bacterium]
MVSYSSLNDKQKEAVIDDSKHLRIIAGAGSGKTRVLTMRIAYLIEQKHINPKNVLAITFTNKAANEMKNRISEMLGEAGDGAFISTIHSLCVRILKEEIGVFGYPKNFTIVDGDDQKTILKEAYKEFNIDKKDLSYGSALDYIANCKYEELSYEKAMDQAYGEKKLVDKANVYKYYDERLKSLYALDFDDLILFTVRLFKLHKDILKKWSSKFIYIHVDEFQDIDKTQYELIKLLSSTHDNVYVVGDPDQTIYTWRGADVNIIVNFDKDFKNTKTIILNQNYRSTNNILEGANSLIKYNKSRVPKDLFSENGDGDKIVHKTLPDETSEAYYIVSCIQSLLKQGYEYNDIAILYRSNYLSREVEKVFIENRIPYVIYGGIRFYERMEVKDILSYLRLIVTGDDLAFQRVINQPKRGIGQKSIDTIFSLAKENNISMYEVVKQGLFAKNQSVLESFVDMVERWKSSLDGKPLEEVLTDVFEQSGYRSMLEKENETERIENVKSLIDDIKDYQETYPGSTLADYLSMISLYTDKANTDGSASVSLMTIHASKGLEFKVVFVVGLSEGIFPSERTMLEQKGVEEERRLAYVAYTRAKEKLTLTDTSSFSYVVNSAKTTSRFVNEVDEKYIEHLDKPVLKQQSVFDVPFTTKISSIESKKESPRRPSRYRKSDVVIHKIFGEGVVVKCDGDFVTVAFSYPHGTKTIKADHPSIRKKTANEYN